MQRLQRIIWMNDKRIKDDLFQFAYEFSIRIQFGIAKMNLQNASFVKFKF